MRTYINFPPPLTGLYAPGDGVTNVFGSFGFMWSVGATGSSLPKTKKSQLGKKNFLKRNNNLILKGFSICCVNFIHWIWNHLIAESKCEIKFTQFKHSCYEDQVVYK